MGRKAAGTAGFGGGGELSPRSLGVEPLGAQPLAVPGQPEQRDQHRPALEAAGVEQREGGFDRQHADLDVLVLVLHAEQAAGPARVDAGDEEVHDLGVAAGRGKVAAGLDQCRAAQAGFLGQLAARRRRAVLAGVDHAGDRLDLPGVAAADEGRQAELLDQHDLVADRVVGQHHGDLAAHHDLAVQRAGPAAGEAAVAQAEAVDPHPVVVQRGALEDLDRGLVE